MCRFVPEKNLHHLVSAFGEMVKGLNGEMVKGLNGEMVKGLKLVLAGDTDFEDGF